MRRIYITTMVLFALSIGYIHAQSTSHNYVKTVTMLDANGTDSLQAVQYYNGLGYPTLAVATADAQGGTAYALTTYDGCGREKRKYAPAPGTSLDHITESSMQYKGMMFYSDNYAFTQNHLDALDRVTAVDIAGYRWRNAGKQDRTEYRANDAADNVLHYEATASDNDGGLILPSNTSCQHYPSGSLRKVTSYDADGKSVTVFTDMQGRKILERSAAGDTYYVYNNLDQLRFVLPPACQNSGDHTIFSYEYRYDNRGRVIKKILPQAGTTQYWYDKADRVAYMKDPALGSRYRFYLYDRFGRLCVQGTCSGRTSSESTLSSTAFMAGTNGICGTGYTVPYSIGNPQLEIVNYYDNYSFISANFSNRMPTVSISDNQRQYARGSLTGTLVYATNGEALGSINVYDQKGQVVRSVRKGLGGFAEDVSTAYTFTGAVENTEASVNVGYGSNFIAQTDYEYSYGKKTQMTMSLSHGTSVKSGSTQYSYDNIGRLSGKRIQMNNTNWFDYSYSYDVHGWLTGISSQGFSENLYYADGLSGGCYNGNISSVKWKNGNNASVQGYNLEYDDCNRLCNAVFGAGNDLSENSNLFNENVEYDENGNITRLQRRGLVDNMHGGFGLVDNLYMTYNGNQLTSVRDAASQLAYTGATDFNGVRNQEYALAYNESGSLVSDASRKIAHIDYDCRNNPVRIQFTDGNVTKYVYSATGEKLRVIYQTAVPNITVAIGSTRELTIYETLHTETIDYLLGGALTLRNGRIDKYQFDEGYCQVSSSTSTTDNFMLFYYEKDHLGNVRQVRKVNRSRNGEVVQTNNYYPFGAEFCDGNANTSVQSRKYNGKEFDRMHGLNTYDYGARQYNPVTARWDRIDPLAHDDYGISPYVYCKDNPLNRIDPDGKKSHNWIAVRNNNSHDKFLRDNSAYHRSNYDDQVVNIWAHGMPPEGDPYGLANTLEISVNPNGEHGNYYTTKDSERLDKLISREENDWKNYRGGNPIIVLHACRASEFAKELSATKEFKDVIIIAPGTKVTSSKDKGEKVKNRFDVKTKKLSPGKWYVYKNGKAVLDKNNKPITYNANEQPGTIGFNYRLPQK